MSNSYQSFLKVVQDSTHQAEYILQSSSTRTVDCTLPVLISPPSPLAPPTPPTNTKACVPPFIPMPIVPEPFPIPENCPNGITFEEQAVNIYAQLSDVVANNPADTLTIGIVPGPTVCDFHINLPPIVIPCYPVGPQLSSEADVTVVDPNLDTTSTTTIDIVQDPTAPCTWKITGNPVITFPSIPCATGFKFVDAAVINLGTPAAPNVTPKTTYNTGLNVNSYAFGLTLPSGLIIGTAATVSISPQDSRPVYKYTWAASNPLIASLGGTPPVTGSSVSLTPIAPGMITLFLHVDINNGELIGDFSYPISVSAVPSSSSTLPSDGLALISLQEYQASLDMPVTSDCGAALVGTLNLGMTCPHGYTVTGSNVVFGATNAPYTGTAASSTVNLVETGCTLGFDNHAIPALLCPGGFFKPSVAITVLNNSTGTPLAGASFTMNSPSSADFASGNTGSQYCGFVLNGTLTLPPPGTGGGGSGTDPYASHYQPTPYDPATSYNQFDIVRVPGTSAYANVCTPGVYICVKSGGIAGGGSVTTTGPRSPASSSGENSGYWHWLATWPSQSYFCSTTGPQTIITDSQPQI